MAIRIETIRQAAARHTAAMESITEAKAKGSKTLFLCHSHKDADLVKGVVNLLKGSGWKIYVDWTDTSMPDKPNKETATKIKDKIKSLDYFLFLATKNSMASRWCPWEIGYADGVKKLDNILIFPVEEMGVSYGNEYLDLYRKIDLTNENSLAVWTPGFLIKTPLQTL